MNWLNACVRCLDLLHRNYRMVRLPARRDFSQSSMYHLRIFSPKFVVMSDRKSADGRYQLSATRSVIGRYRLIPTNLCTARTVTHSVNIVSPSAWFEEEELTTYTFPNSWRLADQFCGHHLPRHPTCRSTGRQQSLLILSFLYFVAVTGDHMQAWSVDVCVGVLHLHHLHHANPGRIHTTCLFKHRCS